ncbi:hypothetical protein SGRIM128S_03315 [Streptomyces griseomycini]
MVQEPLRHWHQEMVPVAGGFLSSLLGLAAVSETSFGLNDSFGGAADGFWMCCVVCQHCSLESLGLVVCRVGSLHRKRRRQLAPFGPSGTRVSNSSSLMNLSALTQVLPELNALESGRLLFLRRKFAKDAGVLLGV